MVGRCDQEDGCRCRSRSQRCEPVSCIEHLQVHILIGWQWLIARWGRSFRGYSNASLRAKDTSSSMTRSPHVRHLLCGISYLPSHLQPNLRGLVVVYTVKRLRELNIRTGIISNTDARMRWSLRAP